MNEAIGVGGGLSRDDSPRSCLIGGSNAASLSSSSSSLSMRDEARISGRVRSVLEEPAGRLL